MADNVRNLTPLEAAEVVGGFNKLRADSLRLRGGLIFHADATPIPAGLVNPPVVLADCEADLAILSAAWVAHIGSACNATSGQGAHLAVDTTDVFTTPAATDETSSQNRANELKSLFNTHLGSTTYHPVADGTNTIAASNATNLGTLVTLVTAEIVALTAHFAAAFSSQAIQLEPA